jgi:glycosyltransferase 2 family protein
MLRALPPVPFAVTARRAWRVRGLPRGKLIFAARWLVTALALWVVLRSIDLGAVVDLIGRAAPLALGVAGLVVIAQFAVLVWRWQLVIHILGGPILGGKAVGFGPLALLLGHSFLIGQVLPSSVGGDVARTVLLSRSTGVAAAARSVICDRLLGFAALALLVVPTVPVIAEMIGSITPFLTLTICALGIMTAVALVLAYSLTYGFPWLGRHLATVAGDVGITLRSGKIGLVAMALGIGSSLLGVLLIYIIGSAIGADLRALDCLVLVPPVLLVSALPISLGGWGVREGALVAAFSLVHADPAAVAATSVMFGLTTPLMGGIAAAIALLPGMGDIAMGSRDGG